MQNNWSRARFFDDTNRHLMSHTEREDTQAVLYDFYRVHFADRTNVLLPISQDDPPQDTIVQVCKAHGWNVDEIQYIHLEKKDFDPSKQR